MRAIDGFALSDDRAALLDDRSFASSSIRRATIDRWRMLRFIDTVVQISVVILYQSINRKILGGLSSGTTARSTGDSQLMSNK